MSACHQALQPIDIIESPIQLNQCRKIGRVFNLFCLLRMRRWSIIFKGFGRKRFPASGTPQFLLSDTGASICT